MAEGPPWRISARVAVLDSDLGAILAGRGVSRLTVDADEVRVEGGLALPSCAVEIRCRVLESREGVLDVSALPPPPLDVPVAPDGTPTAPDGQDGAPGAPGGKGGDVRIHCGRIDGMLRVVAHGAAGGASQGGGRGVKPARRNGSDGLFRKVPKQFGPWGGSVVKDGDGSAGFMNLHWPATRLVTVSYGEPGPAGAKGGDGGAPGQPGRGGDGGDIVVECLQPLTTPPELASAGGATGDCGKGGHGGEGGDGGRGGLHRMYYKHGKYEYDVPMNASLKEAGWAREDWKVPVRARDSTVKGPAGRDCDTVIGATPGRAGQGRCQRVDLAELARSFALGYVEQVRAWAEGAPPEREAIARWGLALLDHLVGPDDPAGVSLRESLKGLLPEPP